MKFIYLVCSRNVTRERIGVTASAFTDSEIERFISELHSKELSSVERDSPRVLHCFSSSKKALNARDKFNSIKDYTRFVCTYKNVEGRDYLRKLTVYDYYIVRSVLE